MIQIRQTTRALPFYKPVPLTNLPLPYHREHHFPYSSYGETAAVPVSREFRMVILENEFLRVEVAPELGGRVYSLLDKRIGKEILFSNPVVKPVRILPIWGFISGGIEFNFPIAHSPTSIAPVGCAGSYHANYGFIRVGEREARTGMEWAVELGLLEGVPLLIQRTALRNGTGADHPWMMWTICALRSTSETEFVHPRHRVLVHDSRVTELDWPGESLNWDRHYNQMTALFWKPGGAPAFGAYHHDLGHGLMHLADPVQVPGKKLWTYGHGLHRSWGQATSEGGLSYCEIESGPLLDQSEKPLFAHGTEKRFTELWMPVHSRKECEEVKLPELDLPPWPDPWLGWQHSRWQREWEAFRQGAGPLPYSVVPTGVALESALRGELEKGNSKAVEPLALWLAFHGRPKEALNVIEDITEPTARRVAGLILWKALGDPRRAVSFLESGPLSDPVAVLELDELYAELGLTEKRKALLSAAPAHRFVTERRAQWALVMGDARETLRLLTRSDWPRQHQRYVRTALWKQAKAELGEPDDVPDFLNEDNLAQFGAYWSE